MARITDPYYFKLSFDQKGYLEADEASDRATTLVELCRSWRRERLAGDSATSAIGFAEFLGAAHQR